MEQSETVKELVKLINMESSQKILSFIHHKQNKMTFNPFELGFCPLEKTWGGEGGVPLHNNLVISWQMNHGRNTLLDCLQICKNEMKSLLFGLAVTH